MGGSVLVGQPAAALAKSTIAMSPITRYQAYYSAGPSLEGHQAARDLLYRLSDDLMLIILSAQYDVYDLLALTKY